MANKMNVLHLSQILNTQPFQGLPIPVASFLWLTVCTSADHVEKFTQHRLGVCLTPAVTCCTSCSVAMATAAITLSTSRPASKGCCQPRPSGLSRGWGPWGGICLQSVPWEGPLIGNPGCHPGLRLWLYLKLCRATPDWQVEYHLLPPGDPLGRSAGAA